MASHSKCFPFEKNIVINALYDTLDALKLSLDRANSARGTLIVSNPEHTGKMRIALSIDAKQTLVEVFPENGDRNFTELWSPVVLNELAGRMKRVYRFENGGTAT